MIDERFVRGLIPILVLASSSLTFSAIQAHAQDPQEAPQQEIEKYEELKKAAEKERIDQTLQQDQTGNDPRVFTNKWRCLIIAIRS